MQKKFTAEEILAALNQYYKESIFITDGEGNIIFVNEVGSRANRSAEGRADVQKCKTAGQRRGLPISLPP